MNLLLLARHYLIGMNNTALTYMISRLDKSGRCMIF
nr:MAG TPA: hypothetical protein [Caudoviricetes sp.]